MLSEAERLVSTTHGHLGLKTISLRPFMLYGEDDMLFTERVANGEQSGANNRLETCYRGNLLSWLLLAERSLDEKPEVTGGRGYFISDSTKSRTRAEVIDLIFKATKPTKVTILDIRVVYFLSVICPWIDWYTCGRLKSLVLQVGTCAITYSYEDTQVDIRLGMKDLGYTCEFSEDQIVNLLATHFSSRSKRM